MESLYVWSEMESPIGLLTFIAAKKGLIRLLFTPIKKSSFVGRLEKNDLELFPYMEQVQQYFSQKRRAFDMPLVLEGTKFQKSVWSSLQDIPYGQTRSYLDIAKLIRSPRAVRAVGGANNRNPIPIIVPCHRVIGSKGDLIGYGGGICTKEQLLKFESECVSK